MIVAQTKQQVQFASREEFREWLAEHCLSVQGIWLIFGKKGGPKTLSPNEALEEALCFGWIDGQMKRVDEKVYIKYFAQRRKRSAWSDRNKRLIDSLEEQGKMTDHGRAIVKVAKEVGTWDAPPPPPITEDDIAHFAELLRGTEPAYSNFLAMPPSAKKVYTGAHRGSGTENARAKCLAGIIERLNNNLKPTL